MLQCPICQGSVTYRPDDDVWRCWACAREWLPGNQTAPAIDLGKKIRKPPTPRTMHPDEWADQHRDVIEMLDAGHTTADIADTVSLSQSYVRDLRSTLRDYRAAGALP